MASLITLFFVAVSIALLGAFLSVTIREMRRLGQAADGLRVPVTADRQSRRIPSGYRAAFRRAAPAEA